MERRARKKKHLPEYASTKYTGHSGKSRSFKRAEFMNDLTHAGNESFAHVQSNPNFDVKRREDLMNPNLAWGGPYRIPKRIKIPKFAQVISNHPTRQDYILSPHEELQKKSEEHYHTDGRNLNDFATFTGEFIRRRPSGYGILVYQEGEAYRGQWKGGLQEGEGVFITRNGNGYSGQFRKGKPCGRGEIWVWDWFGNKVKDHFKGEWVGGKWNCD